MITVLITGFIGLPSCFAAPNQDTDGTFHAYTRTQMGDKGLEFTVEGVAPGTVVSILCYGDGADGNGMRELRTMAVAK